MLRPLGTFWMHICGLSSLKLGPMLWWLVLVLQFLTRNVGIVVPMVRFMGMGVKKLCNRMRPAEPMPTKGCIS